MKRSCLEMGPKILAPRKRLTYAGIVLKLTTLSAYKPYCYGVAELINRIMMKNTQPTLKKGDINVIFWAEEITQTKYLYNRMISTVFNMRPHRRYCREMPPNNAKKEFLNAETIPSWTNQNELVNGTIRQMQTCLSDFLAKDGIYRVYNPRTRLITYTKHITFDKTRFRMSKENREGRLQIMQEDDDVESSNSKDSQEIESHHPANNTNIVCFAPITPGEDEHDELKPENDVYGIKELYQEHGLIERVDTPVPEGSLTNVSMTQLEHNVHNKRMNSATSGGEKKSASTSKRGSTERR